MNYRNRVTRDSLYNDEEKKKLRPTPSCYTLYAANNDDAKVVVNLLMDASHRSLYEVPYTADSIYDAILQQVSHDKVKFKAVDLRRQLAFYMVRHPYIFESVVAKYNPHKESFLSFVQNMFHGRTMPVSEIVLSVVARMWNIKIAVVTPKGIRKYHREVKSDIWIAFNMMKEDHAHYTATKFDNPNWRPLKGASFKGDIQIIKNTKIAAKSALKGMNDRLANAAIEKYNKVTVKADGLKNQIMACKKSMAIIQEQIDSWTENLSNMESDREQLHQELVNLGVDIDMLKKAKVVFSSEPDQSKSVVGTPSKKQLVTAVEPGRKILDAVKKCLELQTKESEGMPHDRNPSTTDEQAVPVPTPVTKPVPPTPVAKPVPPTPPEKPVPPTPVEKPVPPTPVEKPVPPTPVEKPVPPTPPTPVKKTVPPTPVQVEQPPNESLAVVEVHQESDNTIEDIDDVQESKDVNETARQLLEATAKKFPDLQVIKTVKHVSTSDDRENQESINLKLWDNPTLEELKEQSVQDANVTTAPPTPTTVTPTPTTVTTAPPTPTTVTPAQSNIQVIAGVSNFRSAKLDVSSMAPLPLRIPQPTTDSQSVYLGDVGPINYETTEGIQKSIRWGKVLAKPLRYNCTLCGNAFTQTSDLRQHVEQNCKNNPNKIRIPCRVEGCDRDFSNKQYENEHHHEIHLKKLLYFCKVCQEGFYKHSRLVSHKKANHGPSSTVTKPN